MDINDIGPDGLFTRSLEAFRGSLSPQELESFQVFTSAEAMLSELELSLGAAQRGKLSICMKKVSGFSELLTAYFEVVNTFMQPQVEYTGWFWGVILLVCKLGSNYNGFFEKTAGMLGSISTSLPQYRDYVSVCRERKEMDHSRLLNSLAFVYADIIDFCKHIYCMLTRRRPDTKWMHRASFVGDILWRPFEVRFGDLVERMKRHDAIFRREMMVQDSKMLNNLGQGYESLNSMYKRLQESISNGFKRLDQFNESREMHQISAATEQQIDRIRIWMSGVEYRSIYEHSKKFKSEGTGEWVLSEREFQTWSDRDFGEEDAAEKTSSLKSRILMLQGKPGFGKTYLSAFLEMVEDHYFGAVVLPADTVARATGQSNGMFLWASLFTSYLKNPALTPKDRHRFVADSMLFQGLDGLAEAILDRLNQRSEKEKVLVLKIFQWMVAALYPISSATLHAALAITPGEETTDLDYIVDFPGCLPHLTGALIETDAFGRPAFIHVSIREYLISARATRHPHFSLGNATLSRVAGDYHDRSRGKYDQLHVR
ncbi:hypothetical protein NKR23_g567 [Pleurostoma richardsiae]|uniref:Uncharacterized protein n=1 Tax=Pleurostoma richardsiae TaxID=41990 RepID=A0AA38S2R9_9PEZI|nr:hypothetical protein NKR23_g567 [Pleurostoma richardsiae]